MRNFLYNIQARFVPVESEEMKMVLGWDKYPAASLTNDIIIENVDSDDYPTMQFSFPEFYNKDGLPPSETNCLEGYMYEPTLQGYSMSKEDCIEDCRIRCETTKGCAQFYFVGGENCHLAGKDAELREVSEKWARTVGGSVDQCGHKARYTAREGTEIEKAMVIGNGTGNKNKKHRHGEGCPVLFYKDGELVDVSDKKQGDWLVGDKNSHKKKMNYVRWKSFNQIEIVHFTKDGSRSEIMLETAGEGPGELWNCHWNFFVCLPKANKEKFKAKSVGLLGSPDENSTNDWMKPDGTVIPLPTYSDVNDGTRGEEAHKYCTENWCVDEEDSLMVPPAGGSWKDIKCHDEPYVPFDEDTCLASQAQIEAHCGDKDFTDFKYNACREECCIAPGVCPLMEETEEEIEDIIPHSGEDDVTIVDLPPVPDTPSCDDTNHEATGETVCPSAEGSVVKVIHQTADFPADQPVIYGIQFNPSAGDDQGRTVSFKVDNPYGSAADAYVRYEKKVGLYANDPACDSLPELPPGCQEETTVITAGCIEYPDVAPFALVDVYFATDEALNADPDTEVEKCCKAPDYSIGVVKYSFKIQCACPGESAE